MSTLGMILPFFSAEPGAIAKAEGSVKLDRPDCAVRAEDVQRKSTSHCHRMDQSLAPFALAIAAVGERWIAQRYAGPRAGAHTCDYL